MCFNLEIYIFYIQRFLKKSQREFDGYLFLFKLQIFDKPFVTISSSFNLDGKPVPGGRFLADWGLSYVGIAVLLSFSYFVFIAALFCEPALTADPILLSYGDLNVIIGFAS